MALRDAATIRVVSTANTPPARTVLDGIVGDAIDAFANAAALTGKEIVTFDLSAVTNGRDSPVEIIQSGGNLSLEDVVDTLEEKGFRVSPAKKNGRVTFNIAWNV